MINILKDIKRKVKGKGLNTAGPVGPLTDSEHEVIFHLFQVTADNNDFPKEQLKGRIDSLTSTKPGYLEEFQFCAKTLNVITNKIFNKNFQELKPDFLVRQIPFQETIIPICASLLLHLP